MIEDAAPEPPDRNSILLASRILTLFLFIGLALLLFATKHLPLGIALPVALAGALLLLSRLSETFPFLSLLGFGLLVPGAFRPGRRLLTVRIYRLLDDGQREYRVRLKGRIARGIISEYATLAVWGEWQQDNLFFERGYNVTAQEWIHMEGDLQWITTTVLLIINVFLILALFQTYLSWPLG